VGLGIKMFRIANLLLDSKECAIKARLSKYGEVRGDDGGYVGFGVSAVYRYKSTTEY
jgi:hypothetical protein